jgi:hypothetical protein
MRTFFIIFIALTASHALAKPTECPTYKNKRECLLAVDENFQQLLDFLEGYEEDPEQKSRLIDASLDTKKYESLACEKTCFN